MTEGGPSHTLQVKKDSTHSMRSSAVVAAVVALSLVEAAIAGCSDWTGENDCMKDSEGCTWVAGTFYGGTCSLEAGGGGSSNNADVPSTTVCDCSDHNKAWEDTEDTKNACELAGNGKGCQWESGYLSGGDCTGTCVSAGGGGSSKPAGGGQLEVDQKTMQECNIFGTWLDAASVNGGKKDCENATCKWINGSYSGGSCVKGGECNTTNIDAEEDALGTANQATILVCAVAVACFFLAMFQVYDTQSMFSDLTHQPVKLCVYECMCLWVSQCVCSCFHVYDFV